jgi:hypothetical protein
MNSGQAKRHLVRPEIRWENDIKTDSKDTSLEGRTRTGMTWLKIRTSLVGYCKRSVE